MHCPNWPCPGQWGVGDHVVQDPGSQDSPVSDADHTLLSDDHTAPVMSGGAWLTQDPVLPGRTGLLTRSVLMIMTWHWGPPPSSTSGLLCREVRVRKWQRRAAGSGCRNSWVLIEAEQGMDSVTWLWATCQVPVLWGHSAGKMLSICRSGTWGLKWPIRWDLGFWVHWDSQPPGSHELQSCGQSSFDTSQSSIGEAGRLKSIREPWVWVGQTVEKRRQLIQTLWTSLERSPWAAGRTSWPPALFPPLLHPHLWLWGKVTGGESVPRATAQSFLWHFLPLWSFFMLKLSCFGYLHSLQCSPTLNVLSSFRCVQLFATS